MDTLATARVVRAAERALDTIFGMAANPLRQLGALATWLLWIVVASGFWIYALYETSVAGAWSSVQDYTEHQPYAGGLMRSLHRYASDAFIVVSLAHLLREALLGRFRRFRWFSWVSGVPLLWLAVASGLVGYWMVWDLRAQYLGIAVLEWVGVLPGVGLEAVRNFIDVQAISDRFFSLLAFLHIGVPLLLLLGLWVHLQRLTRPAVQPQPALAIGSLVVLVLGSLAWPALSMAPADLDRVPMRVALDWFYLGALPLADRAPWATWALAVAATLALGLLPWWPPRRRAAPARAPVVVDPAHCNGCTLCLADCPYAAITMAPHPAPQLHARAPERIAVVDPALCAGCGVCVGACPSVMPLRRDQPLHTGIDLPGLPLQGLRVRLDRALEQLAAAPAPRVLVLGCDHAAMPRDAAPGTAMLQAPCVAMWPPVFVDYALRHGADGVLVSGCAPEDCAFRLGTRWTQQRLGGARLPVLRRQVPRERLRSHWVLREDTASPDLALRAFRTALGCLQTSDKSGQAGEEQDDD